MVGHGSKFAESGNLSARSENLEGVTAPILEDNFALDWMGFA